MIRWLIGGREKKLKGGWGRRIVVANAKYWLHHIKARIWVKKVQHKFFEIGKHDISNLDTLSLIVMYSICSRDNKTSPYTLLSN